MLEKKFAAQLKVVLDNRFRHQGTGSPVRPATPALVIITSALPLSGVLFILGHRALTRFTNKPLRHK
jgi:hypothetical protein